MGYRVTSWKKSEFEEGRENPEWGEINWMIYMRYTQHIGIIKTSIKDVI